MAKQRKCECGCGESVKRRFRPGHNLRVRNPKLKEGEPSKALGYRWAKAKDHPYANTTGRVLEHRLVMESVIGHPLPPTVHVHHINGDPSDNRPDNLAIVTPGAHKAIHVRERKLAA